VQPTRGVEDHDILTRALRSLQSVLHDLDGIFRVAAVHRDLNLAAQLLELVDRSGPLQVGGNERRLLPLLAQEQGELRGRRP